MVNDLWAALGLMLVLEGVLPFLSPDRLRQALIHMVRLNDRTLRLGGLVSMVAGLIVLYLFR